VQQLELLSQLTQAKKTQERIWLNEASDCALRQSVRQLAQAFQNFFNSCKGKRNGTRSFEPLSAHPQQGRGFEVQTAQAGCWPSKTEAVCNEAFRIAVLWGEEYIN